MINYYFLGTLLSELRLGDSPEIGFREYIQLLKDNLTKADLEKVTTVRRVFDILNLRRYWKEEPLDPLGNFKESDFEEAFATESMLPSYVFDFTNNHEGTSDRLQYFPKLLATFFSREIARTSGFFKDYLILERELRLVLLAFRAKKLGINVISSLQFEDPEDPLVAQILAQKDSEKFEPPEKYEELKDIFEKNQTKPLALQKALFEYRLQKIDELLGLDLFSVERLLAYLVQLIVIENWQEMDKKKGMEIVDSMLKDI